MTAGQFFLETDDTFYENFAGFADFPTLGLINHRFVSFWNTVTWAQNYISNPNRDKSNIKYFQFVKD